MGIFDKTIARALERSRQRAVTLFDEMESRFGKLSLDATVDSLIDYSTSLCDTLSEFGRTIKETVSDFKLVIPFDSKCEKYDCFVEDGEIHVIIEGKNSRRQVASTIPSNCIVDDMNREVNHKKKLLVITIPKDLTNDENLQELKNKATERMKAITDSILGTVKETADTITDQVRNAMPKDEEAVTDEVKEIETVQEPQPEAPKAKKPQKPKKPQQDKKKKPSAKRPKKTPKD